MPYATLGSATIYYEEFGSGYPILALAPGGLDSQVDFWRRRKTGEPRDFPNPIDLLARDFRVIALDQRNAGRSEAPIGPDEGWDSYCADYLGLMDHLGIERFHLIGACIGGPQGFKLVDTAPERVSAFVVQGSSGLSPDNRPLIDQSFAAWSAELLAARPDVDPALLPGMKARMYGGDFVFSVTRDAVRRCRVPMLVLAGRDARHPLAVSEEIVALAPDARLVLDWQGEAHRAVYEKEVRDFFLAHRPG